MTLQTPISGPSPEKRTVPADVFRNGRFETNDWEPIADDAPLPEQRRALLSVSRFLSHAKADDRHPQPLGVVIEPADKIEDIAPYLDRLATVAIHFPKFSDGRGFSHAALLARHGFTGEVRAIGNVLIDQIPFMKRLGFTAFEVTHPVTRRYLSEGRDPAPRHYYQPSVLAEVPVEKRPWLRLKTGDR